MPRHTSSRDDSPGLQIYSPPPHYSSTQYLSDSSQSGGHSPQSPTAHPQSSQPSGSVNGKKKHVCSTCDRGFTTSGHLARHLRVHTGERNHKCPFPGCETRCSRQDNLQQHYRIHLSPGSRRSSSSATRAAIARAVGTCSSGSRNSRTSTSLISSDRNSSNTPSPPPALEHAIPPPPDSPPPLVQAFTLPSSYSDSMHSGSMSSRSPTPPNNTYPAMLNQHSQAMSNGQVTSHSSPIQSHYNDNTPSYDEPSQANYGYVTASVSQPSGAHAVHDHSYDYSQAYTEKSSMSRIHSSSLHQSPMENIHDGSPQSSAHLSSVSSRLSISHISHPQSYPTHYQTVNTPSPDSPHSVSPHSQLSTPNYSAYRDAHEVAPYQNGSGILDSVSDHSGNYINSQNNVAHGSYSHTLMSHHSNIPRYDSPPPVLAPIQDERVLRGDIRIPQMHQSITPPLGNSLSYMHHPQVQSSYPYHAPHVSLAAQGTWKADSALRARPSTGYV